MSDTGLAGLLMSVAAGDRGALRTVYTRESTRLFGVAMAILRDRDAAADAMQTAFLRVWERAGQFDPSRGEARSWLGGIVRFAALDAVRARGREVLTDDPELGDTAVEPVAFTQLAAAQETVRLHDCLAKLDDRHREGIVLAFVHGLSHAQLAERMNEPLGTIKSWIRRGLLSLRECLA